MAKQLTSLIYLLDSILLIGLVVSLLQWQKKHGRLSAHKFAVILTGYFSFLFITTLSPYLITHTRVTIVVDIVFLLILWCIVYPLIRWIYSQFDS